MRKASILIGCLLAALIAIAILSVIYPAKAASSSLPEGAQLGSGMGFRSPFMPYMGGFFGRAMEDMDDIDQGFGGMMGGPFGFGGMMEGSYGSMDPWMMQDMDQPGSR